MRKDTFFNMASEDNFISTINTGANDTLQQVSGTFGLVYTIIANNQVLADAVLEASNNDSNVAFDVQGITYFLVASEVQVDPNYLSVQIIDARGQTQNVISINSAIKNNEGGSVDAYLISNSSADDFEIQVLVDDYYDNVMIKDCSSEDFKVSLIKLWLSTNTYYLSYASGLDANVVSNQIYDAIDLLCRETDLPTQDNTPNLNLSLTDISTQWFNDSNQNCCVLDYPLNPDLPAQEDSSSSINRDIPCEGVSATAWLMDNGYTGEITLEMFGLTALATGQAMVDYITDVCDGVIQLDDGNVEPLPEVEGCMDSSYDNYNPYATINVGCQNYDINTQPTANADNSDLYATLLSLDGDYGDLIEDTIELIQNLQNAYEDALQSGTASSEEVQQLNNQLTDANNQLNELLGSNGLLQAITSAVDSAVDGNYDSSILANVGEIIAPDGSSSSTSVSAINSALQTINTYYSDTSDYAQISDSLATALQEIASLEDQLAIADDGITQTDLDNLNAVISSIQSALADLTDTSPTGQPLLTLSGGLNTQVGQVVTAYNNLVSSYNNLASGYSDLQDLNNDLSGQINDLNDLNNYTDAELLALIQDIQNGVIADLQAEGIPVNANDLADYVANEITNQINAGTLYDAAGLANEISSAITTYINNFVAGTQADATLSAFIEEQVNEAVSGLVTPTDVMMSFDDYNQALQEAADAAIDELVALGIPVTQAELDTYIQNYLTENNLVTETDVMMSTLDFNQAVSEAISAYITENGLLTPQQASDIADEAVAEALEGMIQDTGQAATILDLENQLADAQDTIANLYETLGGSLGTNEVSNATLQAAYATIDDLIAQAEAQFQIYANDIAAYEDFLSSLSDSMTTLENFLTNNYGYNPTGEVKFTIPTPSSTPSPIDETGMNIGSGFNGTNNIPIQDIYLNFAGKAIGVPRGFKRFNGQPRMLNVTGTEATFELKDSTKKLLWGAGIIALTFGALKLIKSK